MANSAIAYTTERIRTLPLFERLSAEQLAILAGQFQILRYDPGAIIFQQGQPAQGLIVYAQGAGMLTRINAAGVDERVSMVEPGIYLGESALYYEEQHTVSLRAVQPSVILFLARRDLAHLLTHQPELRTNLRVPLAPGMTGGALMGDGRASGKRLFKGQREDETVLHLYKRHPWAFLRHYWLPLVGVIGGLLGIVLLGGQSPIFLFGFGFFGFLLPGLVMLYQYLEWRNDFLILTDQRVVRIWDHLLRFENLINEIPLERILEINVEIPPGDPLATLLNYGTLTLKTAGEANNIVLDLMAAPKTIQDVIFAQRDRFQETNEQRQRQAIQADIEQALGLRTANPQAAGQPPRERGRSHDGERVATVGLPFIRTRFMNEQGEVIYRRHSFVWLEHVIIPLLVIAASGLLILFGGFTPLPFGVIAAAAFLLFIVGVIWLYINDWDWRNDLMVLGDDRITLIHRRPLWLQNEEQIVRLAQVDNVVSEVIGLLDNVLNRGTIRISLLGSNEAKVFDKVYDPAAIQAELSHRQSSFKLQEHEQGIRSQQQQMAEYIAVYHQAVTAAPAAPAPPAPTFQPSQPIAPAQPTIPVQAQPTAPETARPHFAPVPAQPTVANSASRQPHLPVRQQPFNSPPAFLTQPAPTVPAGAPPPPPPPDLPELPPLSETIRPPRVPRRRDPQPPPDLPQ